MGRNMKAGDFFVLFWDRVHDIAQADLKLVILLPFPPQCWDYECASPHPAGNFNLYPRFQEMRTGATEAPRSNPSLNWWLGWVPKVLIKGDLVHADDLEDAIGGRGGERMKPQSGKAALTLRNLQHRKMWPKKQGPCCKGLVSYEGI
jgi:hypothetical protein